MSIPLKALQFVTARRIEKMGLVRAGFELETQSSAGCTWNSDESDFDEDGWLDACSDRADEIIGSELEEYISSRLLSQVRDAVLETVHQDEDLRSDYYSEGDPVDALRNAAFIPSGIIIGSDGTVDGFEFRTGGGGVSYPDFVRLATELFKVDHDIDTGCSFHIHLSVVGVKHRFGERLQAAMVEYLAMNVERVPASVRERWEGVRENQYISKLIGETEKYCFIRSHPQGTWEFRCFGNVKRAKDAKRCLDLAISALEHGYRVLLGEAELLRDKYLDEGRDWREAIYSALETGKPFKAYRPRPRPRAANGQFVAIPS